MKVLHLNFNKIKDIQPLSSLVNLVELGLTDNKITEFQALQRLEKLKVINLANNPLLEKFTCPLERGTVCDL
jgi:Leucine-rich repeat (LRR) protein